MFSLDHRLAELRQVGAELRIERQARASGGGTPAASRSARQAIRDWLAGPRLRGRASRPATS